MFKKCREWKSLRCFIMLYLFGAFELSSIWNIFTGPEPVSWIGNIKNLAPISDFVEPPYGEDDNKTPFPIRPAEKHSYAQSCVVWIKPSGLQVSWLSKKKKKKTTHKILSRLLIKKLKECHLTLPIVKHLTF